ncbi:hypothetical protein MLD38_037161 [Melastoma candidum]|uniref:Uncharacterized protein n=1 Tax=Melastoma candidum TaxID=119954 RepID=A0ACB9LMH1_9MYRT|nr:hypothetical protein MLD38_037161 [Melastoma candidum]
MEKGDASADDGGGGGGKRRMVVESLGWLTESSILPKKHRAISGVGASSILELKAQLYQSQEESRKSKELGGPDAASFHRAKKILPPRNSFSSKNSGVAARDLKDKLELKAEKDGTKTYEALERKAALYDKLVRGELSDEDDEEKYCVDFFRKNQELDESERPQANDAPPTEESKDDGDDLGLFDQKTIGPGRTAGMMDKDEHKRFVREVHEEVNEAREKVSELKMRRQRQADARREKLRQAYLRKQLDKLKASAETPQA